MNTESRLRAMFGRADETLRPQAPDWEGFIGRAHRRVVVRRAVAFAAAAALVVVGAVGSRALISGRDTSTPPAVPRYEENPVEVTDVSSTCPEAPGFETGELGAVAFYRAGELHVVDLTTRRDRVLLTGIGDALSSGVRWSTNGRWVSAGGYVVPAAGGEVCTPLGPDAIDVQWAGEDLMMSLGEAGLMVGGPGREAQEIEIQEGSDWMVSSYVLDPLTTMAAVGVNRRNSEAGIWLVDSGTEEATEIATYTSGVEPRIAGWSPDGQWVLFWQIPLGSASLAADGVPLYAVSVEGGQPIQVLDLMLPDRDFLTWCGDTLVATSGGDRYVTVGKRLVAATPPDWDAAEFEAQPNGSVFWPSCSPDGSQLAATSTPDEIEDPLGSLIRTLDILPVQPDNAAAASAMGSQQSLEFPLWSQNHDSQEQVILHVSREPRPQGRAALYLEEKIADLGRSVGYYGNYRYSDVFDWYQP